MSTIDEIKARVDIVDLVSESVQLRHSGKNYTGFCPFHSNTRTPAFVVFPETGTWRCFGECNDGGDIFKFVMKKEGWDFPEALRELARRAGVELQAYSPAQQAQVEENDRLRQLLEEAVTFYHHQLLNTAAGKPALAYLHKRGLNAETIESFGLGYAPDSWDAAIKHFRAKNYSEQELLACGLVSTRDSGEVHDRFRNRVMLPIRDERGRMAGFGARTLDPEGLPKYLNSPQTELFDKSRILFGMDKARSAIRASDQVVIVEGYMGVLAPHQHGFSNVVATMGTALTEEHIQLIKRFTRRIILCMDSDAAGVKATLRGLQVARQTLDREAELSFDARGLLRQEARLQADIRVTTLPPKMDPDDVINRDPAEWEQLIASARPIVEHVMETLARDRDLNDPKAKAEIVGQVMPLVEDLPGAIERDTYRQKLARLLKVNENALMGSARYQPTPSRPSLRPTQARPRRGVQPAQTQLAASLSGMQAREVYLLGVLVRRPELIYHIDRGLQEHGLERVGGQDFQLTDHQLIFRLIQQSLLQDEVEPLDFVLDRLPEQMMSLVDGILVQTVRIDPADKDVLDDLMRALILLRSNSLSQNLDFLRYLQEEAQESGDLKAEAYRSTMAQYADRLGRLHKAQNQYTNRNLQAR